VANSFTLSGRTYARPSGKEQRELMASAQAGDTSARNRLIEAYAPAVLRYVKERCIGGDSDRDDCTQIVFMRLMRACECFELGKGIAVSTYFFTTIFRTIAKFNYERCENARQRLDQPLHAALEGDWLMVPDETADSVMRAEQNACDTLDVAAYLSHVSERERSVLIRCYGQGGTLKAVGKEIGVTKERVRQIRNRAIQTIRAKIGA
jgi:RNA polymerase sigma factor (sigma-70 family)